MSEQKPKELVQMVTPLHSINEQVGGHVIKALLHPGTAAVLSVVMPGLGPDQIVSVPLNPAQFMAIQGMLASVGGSEDLSEAERRAIGFGREDGEE